MDVNFRVGSRCEGARACGTVHGVMGRMPFARTVGAAPVRACLAPGTQMIRLLVAVALGAVLLSVALASPAGAAIFTQEPGSPYAQTGSATDTYGLATGDFNGDGRPDIVAVNGTSSN